MVWKTQWSFYNAQENTSNNNDIIIITIIFIIIIIIIIIIIVRERIYVFMREISWSV